MKKIFTLLFGGFLALTAAADTARPNTFTAHQPDGTTLSLRMVGDEHFHYFIDTNTGRAMRRDANGTYYYATDQEMQQGRAHAKLRRATLDEQRLNRLPGYVAAQREASTASPAVAGPHKVLGEFSGALTGTRRGLVILVNFASSSTGLPYQLQTTHDNWERAFNQVGYSDNDAIGSVHDYFYDQSYGKFDLEFDVVGPVTVSKSIEYYGGNDVTTGNDKNPATMVAEACRLVNSEVNFKDYDWDGDGEVDQVYVIYAGYGESTYGADANTIWPHEYHLSYTMANMYKPLSLDGVKIDTYACSNELCGTSGAKMNGIGTACHEFSHCIGFPDFYDTDYSGAWGMNTFDIMDSGGHNGPNYDCEVPCGYTAYERWMAGWLTPKELTESSMVEGMQDLTDAPDAYIIYNDGNRNEYFLLENRQGKRWYAYNNFNLAYHGLLITHVDYDKKVWMGNNPNNDPKHQRMTIVPAGGTYGTYHSSEQAWGITKSQYQSMLFPGTKRVRTFDDASHFDVAGKLWNRNTDGSYLLHKDLTAISEDYATGTVSFMFRADADAGKRYSVSLAAGDGSVATSLFVQSKHNERIILPAAQPTLDGACFVGWTTEDIDPTHTCPQHVMPAGTAYLPQQDVTLHAVYVYKQGETYVDTYRPVTSLKKGGKYVFANSNKAAVTNLVCLGAAGLNTQEFIKNYAPTPIAFAEGTTDIVAPDESCTWIVQLFDEELVLYNGQCYLSFSNPDGIKLSDEYSYIGWDDTYGLCAVKEGTGTRSYLRVQSGAFTYGRTGSASSRLFAFELSRPAADAGATYYTTMAAGIAPIVTTSSSTDLYDLSGRKLSAPANGVTIQGGKKVLR